MEVHQVFAFNLRVELDLSCWICSSASVPYSRARTPEPTNVWRSTEYNRGGNRCSVRTRRKLAYGQSWSFIEPPPIFSAALHRVCEYNSSASMRSDLPSSMDCPFHAEACSGWPFELVQSALSLVFRDHFNRQHSSLLSE